MRYRDFLRQRYSAVLGYTGLISLLISLSIFVPLVVLLAYPEERGLAWGFWIPAVILALVGLLLWRQLLPQEATSLTLQEGAIIVVLSWLLAIAFSTIPFMAVGGLNFTQAVFESTSGWTTTGLSVVEVEQTSHLVLLFRSVTQLVGGAGFAIIALSAITGPSGTGLTTAEGRSEQLVPNVGRSAKLVFRIYSGYVATGILALRMVGMDWFDAINHSFTTLSTGGFSTHANSVGYWDSPVIEAVIIGLMLCGGLNYLTSYLILTGKFKAVMRNGEVRLQGLLILLGALILFLSVATGLYSTLGKAARVSVFETITALSTTGYATVSYLNWKSLGWLVLILLMMIGGGTGSTAGGIKLNRIYVLYRGVRWEIRRLLLPRNAVTEPNIWQGDRRRFLDDRQIRQVSLFVFLYLFVYVIGSGIIAAYGYSLPESLFEYASALSTVGLSVGVTTADAPTGLLWCEIIGMFLGRLEFFTVIVGIIQILKDAIALWA
ncbi:MAG: TrkH family potassium uptake protein [Leptolyngbyaceae cyanobacterium MO_188.B28]|nr:TrkH family potassium uptake protein [Leptolyngbyaceae cyanobacterium MO_188.B28]